MSKEKTGFFGRLVKGLSKTRESIANGIDGIFHGFSNIDEDFYEELEEVGLAAPQVTYIINRLNKEGFSLETNVTTISEAKEEILKAFRK